MTIDCDRTRAPNASMSSQIVSTLESLAREVEGAHTLIEFRTKLLGVMRSIVAFDSAGLIDTVSPRQGNSNTVGVGSSAQYVDQYLMARERYDASVRKLLCTVKQGTPVIDSDVYERQERERLPIYTDILLPQRTTSVLVAPLRFRGETSGIVVLKRHEKGRPFCAQDAAALRGCLGSLWLVDAGFRSRLRRGARMSGVHQEWLLTRRQAEVAELASKGLTNTEIAGLIGTSHNTVKKQLRCIYEKIGVSNRTELATFVTVRLSDNESVVAGRGMEG